MSLQTKTHEEWLSTLRKMMADCEGDTETFLNGLAIELAERDRATARSWDTQAELAARDGAARRPRRCF